jgi:hypothetical protein
LALYSAWAKESCLGMGRFTVGGKMVSINSH